jgi:hypothetical protein
MPGDKMERLIVSSDRRSHMKSISYAFRRPRFSMICAMEEYLIGV